MHPMPECSVSGADIFDCIQRGNIDQCVHFVQNDRSGLKLKGWGGFTPLHYAALHGNRALVDLFLSNGADPNLTCDSGQTAFHFACRQGNIYIIHKMMQYGADLRLVDLQGKTSLHHAVTGGNIVAVHYLWETGMFRFSDTDMYHVTPLHLASSTGNIDAILYLLRDQRCDVDAIDHQGATALHVAAERGGVEVCWTLLQRSGCRILHQKNYSGLTPLDLSRQGKTFRHQQLTRLLSQYINDPIYQKPRESHVLYYWTLLFPSLSGAVILLVAAMLGGYGGLICALLFPWLARSIFTQYHRMTTYQRLPNPVYLGTLLAGMFHSLLCFYGKMMPNTLAQVSLVHFSMLLGLFCKILMQDPGALDRADADPRFSCIADLVENNQSPHRFCPYYFFRVVWKPDGRDWGLEVKVARSDWLLAPAAANEQATFSHFHPQTLPSQPRPHHSSLLFQPDYTKHCKLCEVCIKDYDHHCLFLNRCIGRGNHRLFLIFILSMVTAHLLFVAMATSYLYSKMSAGSRSLSLWLTLLAEEFWVVAMMIMNALTLLWEVWLLTEQFDAIATGTTTYFRHCESSARQRSLGQRWFVVLSYLLEGRRCVSSRQTREDKTAIEI